QRQQLRDAIGETSMAIDAGLQVINSILGQNDTEAHVGGFALTTGTGKAFFIATQALEIVEYGVNIQTNTSANALVLTLTIAPKFGGSYAAPTVPAGVVITCTGPSAGLVAGQCLTKRVRIPLAPGALVRVDATTGVAAGTGPIFLSADPTAEPGTD